MGALPAKVRLLATQESAFLGEDLPIFVCYYLLAAAEDLFGLFGVSSIIVTGPSLHPFFFLISVYTF